MGNITNYKCDDCGSKDLLIPSWKNQLGIEDYPDANDLDGDAWCNDCVSIVWVETFKEEDL